MKRRETYNTKQKDYILDVIKNIQTEFTIKDIYNKLDKKVGLTTIYRLIDKIEKDGQISKFVGDNSTTYYKYLEKCDEDNHFYLKCDSCGEFIHIDCECIGDLSKHIFNKHNFKPNKDKIIIAGICENCSKEVRKC